MKLFVWADPYPVNYGSSAFFAVAETVEQAREIAKSSPSYCYTEFPNTYDPSATPLGEPTRVLDLPCGEWHEWSE